MSTRDASSTESVELLTAPGERKVWTLSLVHHPDPQMIGRRIALDPQLPLVLGRDSESFGVAVLADRRISRVHASFEARADGSLALEDRGSHNGTFVNGIRQVRATLSSGDVIGLGSLLLLAHHAPWQVWAPSTLPSSPHGVSWMSEQVRRAAQRVADSTWPLVIYGERGVGKDHLARYVHTLSARAPFTVLNPAALDDAQITKRLFGPRDAGGLLQLSSGGTLLIEGLENASVALQTALLPLLDRDDEPSTRDSAVRHDVRVLFSAVESPQTLVEQRKLLPQLADRIGFSTLELPPLRTRPEDIPVHFHAALRDLSMQPCIEPLLMLAMLRYHWPGNVRELRAVVRHAIDGVDAPPELTLTSELARLLAVDPELRLPRSHAPDGVLVAHDGSWFTVGRDYVDLTSRPTLIRVLRALLTHQRAHPNSPLTATTLFTEGWPGESISSQAAAARVYVAVSTLRKLGLRHVLGRKSSGYVLQGPPQLEIVQTPPPHGELS